jgi:hypothetical protein
MRLDQIELCHGSYWSSARVRLESGRILWMDMWNDNGGPHRQGAYYIALSDGEIEEYQAKGGDAPFDRWVLREWNDLDALTAQCVLFEIMSTEKVAQVLRGKLLGDEYSGITHLGNNEGAT